MKSNLRLSHLGWVFLGAVVLVGADRGWQSIGNLKVGNLTVSDAATIPGYGGTGALTLDDGSGASPSFTMTDGTDETAVFSKVDAGFLTLTTDATDGINVLAGNGKIGNGTPGTTQDGEDFYVEGASEFDGASIFDGAIRFNSTINIGGTGMTSTAAELNYLDLTTLGTGAASKALVLDSGDDYTWPATGVLTAGVIGITEGVGAVAGSGVSLVERGSAAVHKTVFTLASVTITVTDAGAAGAVGSLKIYDFPEGHLTILSAHLVTTAVTAGAGGISDTATIDVGLGTVAPAADGELTSTEASMGVLDEILLSGGTAAGGDSTVTTDLIIDGSGGAADGLLNFAVPDADSSASDTFIVSGTWTIIWSNDGDD